MIKRNKSDLEMRFRVQPEPLWRVGKTAPEEIFAPLGCDAGAEFQMFLLTNNLNAKKGKQ